MSLKLQLYGQSYVNIRHVQLSISIDTEQSAEEHSAVSTRLRVKAKIKINRNPNLPSLPRNAAKLDLPRSFRPEMAGPLEVSLSPHSRRDLDSDL